MNKKEIKLIKSLLGDNIFDTLQKSGITQISTNTVTDLEELKVGLKIVPRTVLSFLLRKLKYMKKDSNAVIELPFVENARIEIMKYGPDNYSGELIQNNQIINRFKYRSIPSIGIIILSSFELYNVDLLKKPVESNETDEYKHKESTLQNIIDERLRLRDMIEMVVDKKISQKEAIGQLIREKIHAFLTEKRYSETVASNEYKSEPEECISDRYVSMLKDNLKEVIDRHSGDNEYPKNEIQCEDCDSVMFKKSQKYIKCCVCYGEFMDKKIKLTKSESGKYSIAIPNSFGAFNIKKLIKTIKNGGE